MGRDKAEGRQAVKCSGENENKGKSRSKDCHLDAKLTRGEGWRATRGGW